jgi:hypothetical protein
MPVFIKKYRKRPIEVEAVRILSTTADAIREWVDSDYITVKTVDDAVVVEIITSTGSHMATTGDWLIKGIDGNFYAVTDETFRRLYEVA